MVHMYACLFIAVLCLFTGVWHLFVCGICLFVCLLLDDNDDVGGVYTKA